MYVLRSYIIWSRKYSWYVKQASSSFFSDISMQFTIELFCRYSPQQALRKDLKQSSYFLIKSRWAGALYVSYTKMFHFFYLIFCIYTVSGLSRNGILVTCSLKRETSNGAAIAKQFSSTSEKFSRWNLSVFRWLNGLSCANPAIICF